MCWGGGGGGEWVWVPVATRLFLPRELRKIAPRGGSDSDGARDEWVAAILPFVADSVALTDTGRRLVKAAQEGCARAS
eukprot:COSAG01_NODE_57814_length_310_cov_0.265403_1_plen_77_part_01